MEQSFTEAVASSLVREFLSRKIGSYLKTPKYPIWVVCSKSHFSVLFCLKKELISDWKAERKFDLHYYDELANQQEEIHLPVVTWLQDDNFIQFCLLLHASTSPDPTQVTVIMKYLYVSWYRR
ncbi:probable ubiquitin carboxyl-terminal hydrolase MINDY-4 isoform X4 [Dendrobates tinctorius]|uniref:probable ubiquitin carboxyl-terminal hydrolase MINDY-4 isoform X4 n=1 Tax=Dendrobates tinctorius TaxID=92724 RepID=UPI003CC9F662